MNPVPAAVGAPRLPQVNLLPPEIEQRRSLRRTKRLLLVVLVGFVVLVVGVFAFTWFGRQSAEDELASASAKTTEKQAQLAAFSYLPILEATLENSREARSWAGATDIRWSDQLSAFLEAVPAEISLQTLIVTPVTPLAPVASDGTVFGLQDLGSLSFSGQSTEPIDTASLQEAIDALPGFERSVIDAVELGSADDTDTVYWSYTGSVRITENALSGRTVTTQEIVPIDPATGQPIDGEQE